MNLVISAHEMAAACPGTPAVASDRATLTFGALGAESARHALELSAHEVGPGERVALLVGDPAAWAIAYLGALGAGAVAVLLPFAAPPPELEKALEHARVRAIVLDAEHPHASALRAYAHARSILVFDADAAAGGLIGSPGPVPVRRPTVRPVSRVSAADLAVIVYTSGTTGRPKGVMLTHGNLYSNAVAIARTLRLSPDDRGLSALPFNYSFGLSVLNSHLVAGATVLAERSAIFPVRLLERAHRSAATGLYGTPATLAHIVGRADPSAFELGRIRYIAQAGGALLGTTRSRVEAAFPGVRVIAMYGQTEATARITCMDPDARPRGEDSVGRPVEGTRIEIRDASGAVLPTEAVGDIWVCGPGVMAGYWQDAEGTAAVLVDGWLRTGDIGRLDDGGCLYVCGRTDDMIKTGGFRVYPAEIEAVIEAVVGVREVAVAGRADPALGQVVEAYVVPVAPGAVDPGAIKRACRATLASHKVPVAVNLVADLPRTANGKIRRNLLTTPSERTARA